MRRLIFGANKTIRWFTSFDGARLLLPKQFAPDAEFLQRHAEKCLSGEGVTNE
jgi:hypothetical protein